MSVRKKSHATINAIFGKPLNNPYNSIPLRATPVSGVMIGRRILSS